MRIAIFTEPEYTFLFPSWKQFIEDSKEDIDIVGLFIFPPILPRRRGIEIPLWFLKTFGLWVFIKLVFIAILTRIRLLFSKGPKSFRGISREHNISYYEFSNPNKKEVVELVKGMDVDVIISTCSHIYKKDILMTPKVGVINKHAGPLPSYRGLFPVFWTLLDGELNVGVSIHFMDEEIDKGQLILQEEYKMKFDSVYDAYKLIYSDFPRMMLDALELVKRGGPYREYPNRKSSYFSLPKRSDYKKLLKAGKKFI